MESDIVALENAHHHKYERFRFLTLAKLSREDQGQYRDWDHRGIDNKIEVLGLKDDKEDLELTSEYEEEIEFQESDIHLERIRSVIEQRALSAQSQQT